MDVSDELARKAEKEKRSPVKAVASSLTTQQIVLAGVIIIGLFYFIYIWKKMEEKQGWIIGIIIVGILYLLFAKGQRGMIPIRKAKALLLNELRYIQKETKELSPGRIYIRPHCGIEKDRRERPVSYLIKFEIIQWNDLRTIFVGEVDCYNGQILGISEELEGFDGMEKKPIRIIREEPGGAPIGGYEMGP